MAKKETLLKELDWVTEKISSQIWTLNLGTLGTSWSLLITSTLPENLKFTVADARWIFLLCLAALLCEMGQYISAYIMFRRALNALEVNSSSEFSFDKDVLTYKLRLVFFYLKILLTISASFLLLGTVFWKRG